MSDPSNPSFSEPLYATPRRKFGSLRAIFALILREMATTYGRSPGGYIWAIAEPVAGITFLTVVFSLMLAAPPIGNSFALFYATGMLTFLMFSDVQGRVMMALLYSKPLLAYPTVNFFDALLARAILAGMTSLLNTILVAGGAIYFFEGPIRVNYITVLEGLGLTALLGLGIGSLNCYITMKLPVWQQAWSMLMRPMFILSGVMMLYSGLPLEVRDYFWWNPLVHCIGIVRSGFYENYEGSYLSPAFVLFVSLSTLCLGLLLLRRNYRDLLVAN